MKRNEARRKGKEGGKKLTSKCRIGTHNIDIISLLFGSLLGASRGEYRQQSVRFILEQENSNCEYLFWYHNYLATRGYCNTEKPKLNKRIGPNGKIRFYYKIATFSFGNLKWLYDCFYEQGKKRVPKSGVLLQYLTPLALAVWTAGGPPRRPAGTKSESTPGTAALSRLTRSRRLKRILEVRYGLPAREASKQKTGRAENHLDFTKERLPTLAHIVKPYLGQSMYHKLNGWL